MADLTLTAADGTAFSAYRADPLGAPRGGVVVIQEIFGVNAHIRDVTDQYATDGYAPGAVGGGGGVMAIRAFAKSAGAPVPDGGESVLVDLGREDVEVVVDVELTATLVDPG